MNRMREITSSGVLRCACKGTAAEQLTAAVSRFLDEFRAPTAAQPQSLTIEAAAAQLDADPSYVGRLCKAGVIASIRRGKFIRIEQSDLDDFKRRHRNVRRVSHLNRA